MQKEKANGKKIVTLTKKGSRGGAVGEVLIQGRHCDIKSGRRRYMPAKKQLNKILRWGSKTRFPVGAGKRRKEVGTKRACSDGGGSTEASHGSGKKIRQRGGKRKSPTFENQLNSPLKGRGKGRSSESAVGGPELYCLRKEHMKKVLLKAEGCFVLEGRGSAEKRRIFAQGQSRGGSVLTRFWRGRKEILRGRSICIKSSGTRLTENGAPLQETMVPGFRRTLE